MGSDYEISAIETFIDYNEGGEDKITVYISFKLLAPTLKGKKLLLTKSPNLRLTHENSYHVGIKQYDCGSGFICYEFDDSGQYSLVETFAGNVFGHSDQGVNLKFTLRTNQNAVATDVPLQVTLHNLADLNLDTVFPEPVEKYPTGIVFRFVPPKEHHNLNNVIITGWDRKTMYATQFKLFLLGTLLGILTSLITSILLEAVQKFETNRNKA